MFPTLSNRIALTCITLTSAFAFIACDGGGGGKTEIRTKGGSGSTVNSKLISELQDASWCYAYEEEGQNHIDRVTFKRDGTLVQDFFQSTKDGVFGAPTGKTEGKWVLRGNQLTVTVGDKVQVTQVNLQNSKTEEDGILVFTSTAKGEENLKKSRYPCDTKSKSE